MALHPFRGACRRGTRPPLREAPRVRGAAQALPRRIPGLTREPNSPKLFSKQAAFQRMEGKMRKRGISWAGVLVWSMASMANPQRAVAIEPECELPDETLTDWNDPSLTPYLRLLYAVMDGSETQVKRALND